MSEAQETRKLAANWREYIAESQEGFRVYAWVWKELIGRDGKRWILRGLGWLVIAQLFGALEPWCIRSVLDGTAGRDADMIMLGLSGFLGCLLFRELFNYLHKRCREYAEGETVGFIDTRTSQLFFEKSMGQHMQESGSLTSSNIEKGRSRAMEVEHVIFDGVPALIDMCVAYVLLWFVSWFAGAAMTLLIASHMAWMLYMNRKIIQDATPLETEYRWYNRYRVERWDTIERVKTSGKETEEVAFMDNWFFGQFIEKDRILWLWAIKMGSWRTVVNILAVCTVFAYGAWRVWQGDWTIGILYPLFSWSQQVASNLWRVSAMEHRLNRNMPSVRSMMQALTMQPDVAEKADAVALPHGPVHVDVVNVSHRYQAKASDLEDAAMGSLTCARPNDASETTPSVLKNASFSIASGEKVALIGASGAGKTTIMRLLQRYMDPDHGDILVNGLPLRDAKLASWQQLVGYVPQQAQVLDGTLRYNLLYGLSEEERATVTDEELWRIMKLLQIDFGERLTRGLDTIVGRRGIKLSGGQAQRLMIGAAVLKRPRFMIVDEATSSLDSSTEKAVQEGLAATLAEETSALIITHRLSTVRHLCTKFIVLRTTDELRNGDAQVEAIASSFEELYKASPTFRRLADDQGIAIF